MAEVALRRQAVAHHLLDLARLGKAPALLARPQPFILEMDLE